MQKLNRILILLLLAMETGYLVYNYKRLQPLEEARFTVQPGKNYSLLIDDERLPIETRVGQDIWILVTGTEYRPFNLPERTIIPQLKQEYSRSKIRESRFRFYYDRPADLAILYKSEHLEKLRNATDWKTVEAVLKRVRTDLTPGKPGVYPGQNAVNILKIARSGTEPAFCPQYCYLTVQFLQSLGYFARYVTLVGHEVCEVWLPKDKRWVCLDPTNGIYYVDGKGTALSVLQVAQGRGKEKIWAKRLDGSQFEPSVEEYGKVWYWLCNDLATHPVNIYDLNKYKVRAVLSSSEVKELRLRDLYTFEPLELYDPPSETDIRI